jgi:hypothetical protein
MQIALTLALLTLADATATGFLNIVRMRLGFNPHNIALVQVAFGIPSTWAALMATIVRSRLHPRCRLRRHRRGWNAPDGGFLRDVQMVGRSVLNGVQVRQLAVGSIAFRRSGYLCLPGASGTNRKPTWAFRSP